MNKNDIVSFAVHESLDIAKYLSDIKDEDTIDFIDQIMRARRVFFGGAGRSLLSMKMFAMRLMQLGLETYLAGEVCTPGLRDGDLFIAATCSGTTEITCMQARKARSAGAQLAIITSGPDNCDADCLVRFPDPYKFQESWTGDTEEDRTIKRSPKSLFESALLLYTDSIVEYLKDAFHMSHSDMHKNHANLE